MAAIVQSDIQIDHFLVIEYFDVLLYVMAAVVFNIN